MKKLSLIILLFCLLGCDTDEEVSVYTGNEQQYALSQASNFPVNGFVVFRERRDNLTEIKISLTGTEGDINHPAHLHYGNISNPDADMALLLTPVNGNTGESISLANALNDETPMTYDDFINFDGHIKIHQDDGPNKNVILALGNIGSAAN
ncbi:MAG TPA: hypothetical protein PKL31_09255 [Fulvivirga sp.]|nr:hypothetical protein [Fulvivirga sp.]